MKAKIARLESSIKPGFTVAIAQSLVLFAIAACSLTQTSPDAARVDQTAGSSTRQTSSQPSTTGTSEAVRTLDVRRTTVVEGLERPWSVVWLPDGAMLITERPGRLRIVRNGVLDPNSITGIPEV